MADPQKGYNRKDSYDVTMNTGNSGRGKGQDRDKIKAELEKIVQKGQLTPRDILDLSDRYRDNESIVEEVLRLYSKRHEKTNEKIRELARKVHTKYLNGNRPLHEILNKMIRYKEKNNWTDAEYDQFRRELSSLLHGLKSHQSIRSDYGHGMYASRINRTLGINPPEQTGLRIKDTEQQVVTDIISNYERNRHLHYAVSIQGLTYDDCSIVSMSGKYDSSSHISSNHIPSLIACMFLPKFNIFETHMLYASIANIIKTRAEKRPITNEPDALLYNDILSDPNDVVCDANSPIIDLRNRSRVQTRLWEMVLKLREGNYYNVEPINELTAALDTCRNNLYDNADLAYNRDVGSMLRKILSVFSLRPTIISTSPLQGLGGLGLPTMNYSAGIGLQMTGGNHYQDGQVFYHNPVTTVTTIPMITFTMHDNSSASDLRSALNQTIWITEDKTLVVKQQNIIYSKEVLIFYVNRNVPKMQVRSFANPIQFSRLPLALNSFEKLNSKPIYVPDRISLTNSDETFLLRSVVALKEITVQNGSNITEIVSGNVGLIMSHRDLNAGKFEAKYYLYDPQGASLPIAVKKDSDEYYTTNKPISYISDVTATPFGADNEELKSTSFFERATKYGTVFFYSKTSGYNQYNNDFAI